LPAKGAAVGEGGCKDTLHLKSQPGGPDIGDLKGRQWQRQRQQQQLGTTAAPSRHSPLHQLDIMPMGLTRTPVESNGA